MYLRYCTALTHDKATAKVDSFKTTSKMLPSVCTDLLSVV